VTPNSFTSILQLILFLDKLKHVFIRGFLPTAKAWNLSGLNLI
jgi:hypothetical protein